MSHFHLLGLFEHQPRICRPLDYFSQRDCVLDCRQENSIEFHATAELGWGVKFYVMSHNPKPGNFGDVNWRPIKVDQYAWIASDAILYNCHIGEYAVVAVGSVVRSQIVPPYTMVAGNPARVIKEWNSQTKTWVKVDRELKSMERV